VSQDRVRSALLSFLLTASDIRNRDGSKPALGQLRADVRQQATPTPLTVELVAQLSPVFAAFGLVLVAACANVSNVMLARGNARHREIAVRLSLGAARSRIVRALLTEGVLIALLAGVVGLVLGAVTLRLGTAVFLGSLPAAISNQLYVMPLTLDHRVFLFALAVSAAATLAFALLPALQATRLTLTDALRGQPSGHLHASTLRNLLIIGQVTVSIVLLVCAATLVRNSAALAATDLGFETAGVLRVRPPARDAHALLPRIVERLAQEAGEDGIAVTSRYPLSGGVDRVAVVAADETPASAGETRSGEARSDGARSGQGPSEETRPGAAGGDCGGGGRIAGEGSRDDAAAGRQGCAETRAAANAVPYRFVSPEYFSLLRIPIVRGRNFVADETAVEAPVGIISAATARRLWPGVDPIGRTIRIEAPEGREVDALPGYATVTIVGVAQDVVSGMVYQGRDIAQLYLPTSVTGTRGTSLLVRGRRADSVLARVQPLLADPLAFEVLTLDELLDMQIYPLRAASLIGSLLGAIALVLTIAGLYGVLAYTWGQRTREIGIRIALGATTRTVISLVMKQSARLTAMGAAVGLAIAYAALEGLNAAIELRNVAVIDAYAFAGAIAIVAGAAALAAYAPARRAARVDPSRTLRADG
jgi:hypothetical protein